MPTKTRIVPKTEALPDLPENSPFHGLTFKQNTYAKARVTGSRVLEAYLIAYRPDMPFERYKIMHPKDQQRVRNVAARTETNPKVKARMRDLMLEMEQRNPTVNRIDKDFVLNGVMEIALNDEKGSVRLRAYELIGKGLGVWDAPTTPDKAEAVSVAEIDKELREKLSKALSLILEESKKIDGAMKPVN